MQSALVLIICLQQTRMNENNSKFRKRGSGIAARGTKSEE